MGIPPPPTDDNLNGLKTWMNIIFISMKQVIVMLNEIEFLF